MIFHHKKAGVGDFLLDIVGTCNLLTNGRASNEGYSDRVMEEAAGYYGSYFN